jgi:hypothetical protein
VALPKSMRDAVSEYAVDDISVDRSKTQRVGVSCRRAHRPGDLPPLIDQILLLARTGS